MIKIVTGALALSLLAGTAFAAESFPGSNSATNSITIGNTTGTITNGGDFSQNYGSINVGPVANIQSFVDSDVHAPTFHPGTPGTGDLSYSPASIVSIGSNTSYAKNFTAAFNPEGWNVPSSTWTVNLIVDLPLSGDIINEKADSDPAK